MEPKQMRAFEQRSPGRRLGMLYRLTMAYLAPALREIGVTRGQIGFLMSVLLYEGINQEELSQRLCIDRAATARSLLELERDGLVRREEDPDDRRKKRVHPTDKARALLPGLVSLLDRQNKALFAGLEVDEQTRFLDMLDLLVANLRTAVEEAGR